MSVAKVFKKNLYLSNFPSFLKKLQFLPPTFAHQLFEAVRQDDTEHIMDVLQLLLREPAAITDCVTHTPPTSLIAQIIDLFLFERLYGQGPERIQARRRLNEIVNSKSFRWIDDVRTEKQNNN